MVHCELQGLALAAEHRARVAHVGGQQPGLAAVPERDGHHACGAALGPPDAPLAQPCRQHRLGCASLDTLANDGPVSLRQGSPAKQ